VASGTPWREHAVEQAPVIYFAGEGAFSLQRRIRAWLEYHQLAAPPVYFQTRPLDFRDPDIIEQARDALANYMAPTSEHEPGLRPKLLIIDTLSQFFGGGEENGPDMAQFVSHCRYLAQEETCAVVIVHHTNKGGISERGHTALRGNSDVMYSILGEEQQSVLTTILLTNDKNRDNPKVKPLRLPLDVVSFGPKWDSQHENPTSSLVISVREITTVKNRVEESLTETLSNLLYVGGTIEDTSKETMAHEDWLTAYSGGRSAFYRFLGKLTKIKAIKPAGHGKSQFTFEGRQAWFRIDKSGIMRNKGV
jgi:hypothetical protein